MRVAVIGGGYAGLAAAVTLAQQDVPVTLFEAGKQLGGRARGVESHGLMLDNGQHILLGAYRETLRLMALTGANPDDVTRLPLELAVSGHFELKTPRLPAPLHLLAGLLGARGFTWDERLSAIRFASMLRLQEFQLKQDESVASLFARHRQGGNIVRLLWEPLCLAALNTPISQASAQVFLNVLRDSFSHARSDSDLVLPRVDLSTLFPLKASAYIQNRGGTLHANARIRNLERDGADFVLEWDGGREAFSHVICATAPQHALPLLAGLQELASATRLISSFSYQPIATVYLQYPDSVRLPRPMLGMSGGHAHWVFDRGQTHLTPGLLAAVISAEGAYQDLAPEQLAAAIDMELKREFGLPTPLWHQVITEKRATFCCSVGLERPHQVTVLANFYLAGDYTAGDYPATLEGAVKSGVKCAKLICETP